MKTHSLVIFFCLIICFISFSSDRDNFSIAIENYNNKNYEAALEKLNGLKKIGYDNFEVNFNLGACYFKLKRYGEARYYFERALFFKPFDSDLFFNLKVLYNTVLDSPKSGEIDVMNRRIIFFFPRELLIIFFLVSFIISVISLFLYVKIEGLRRLFLIVLISSFTLSIIFSSIFITQSLEFNKKIFIVKEKSSNVYLSPTDSNSLILTISLASKGKIITDIGDYIRINMPDGSTGWIKKSTIISNE